MNAAESIKLIDILPESLGSWKASRTLPLAVPNDLYNYIDGGAELYISYGFGEALSRTYSRQDQPEVLAEVYDLLQARNAFGVFTQTREEESRQYGQGTYIIPGAVFFWKDRYYISLSTWDATQGGMDFIHELATHIEGKITSEGKVPDLVRFLPREGMIPFGYKYFHHPVWLNSYFFISDHNVLLIDDRTDALLTRYANGEKRLYLLLVQYASNEAADKAYQTFGLEFFPEGLLNHCLKRTDQTWMAASISGNRIASVWNGDTQESVSLLLHRTLDNFKTIDIH
jgi:hypothetical protein